MGLLKYVEWEAATGWRCGDVSNLAMGSNSWWYPARAMKISIEEFIILLKDKYHAKNFVYFKDKNLLLYQFENYIDCHKFCLAVNLAARKNKFMIKAG